MIKKIKEGCEAESEILVRVRPIYIGLARGKGIGWLMTKMPKKNQRKMKRNKSGVCGDRKRITGWSGKEVDKNECWLETLSESLSKSHFSLRKNMVHR